MPNLLKLFLIPSLSILFTACSINQNVQPIPEATKIDKVWVENNPRALNENLETEIVRSIKNLGFESEIYQLNMQPENSIFTMKYTANWRWDLAMYLQYFKAELYENNKEIGSILYDARSGGANLEKFGRTMSKVDPLIKELFKNAGHADKVIIQNTAKNPPPPNTPVQTTTSKLEELKNMYEQGLITQNEYDKKRTTLIEAY